MPKIRFSGFGGKRLAEAGCELLGDTVSRAAMIYNVFKQLGYYKKLIKQANAFFEGIYDLKDPFDHRIF